MSSNYISYFHININKEKNLFIYINNDNKKNIYKISYENSNIKKYFINYKTDYYLFSNNNYDKLKKYYNPKIITNLKIDQLHNLINFQSYDLIIISPYNITINFEINKLDKNIIYYNNDFFIFYEKNIKNFLKEWKSNNKKFTLLNDITFNKDYYYDINLIYCIIILSKNKSIKYKIIPIKDTPHYKYLIGKKEEYIKYLSNNFSKKHTTENYDKLVKEYTSYNDFHFSIKEKNNKIILFDGIHRLSILLSKNVKFVKLKYQHKFDILDKRKHEMIKIEK